LRATAANAYTHADGNRQPDANSDTHSYRGGYGNGHSNSHCHTYAYFDAQADTDAENDAGAKNAADTAAASVSFIYEKETHCLFVYEKEAHCSIRFLELTPFDWAPHNPDGCCSGVAGRWYVRRTRREHYASAAKLRCY
jgi:hypothetical protein